MKVQVVGKEHRSGTSKKTGREYDANVIYIVHTRNGVEGHAVDTLWLDPTSFPIKDIKVGSSYNLDRDGRGYLISFDLI